MWSTYTHQKHRAQCWINKVVTEGKYCMTPLMRALESSTVLRQMVEWCQGLERQCLMLCGGWRAYGGLLRSGYTLLSYSVLYKWVFQAVHCPRSHFTINFSLCLREKRWLQMLGRAETILSPLSCQVPSIQDRQIWLILGVGEKDFGTAEYPVVLPPCLRSARSSVQSESSQTDVSLEAEVTG